MAAGFCPKNNGFARVWELQPPGSYAYAPEVHIPSVGFLFFFLFLWGGVIINFVAHWFSVSDLLFALWLDSDGQS